MSVVTSACQSGLLESDRWVVMEAALLRPISTLAGSVCVEGGRWARGGRASWGSRMHAARLASGVAGPQTPW